AFNRWQNPPVPYYMKFYIFEVTNGREFQNGGKAKLTERGPYVFRVVKKKKIVKISNDGANIEYQEFKSYHFVPELSKGKLDDKITFINIPAISAAKEVQKKSFLSQIALSGIFRQLNEKVVERKTVQQILFSGYEVVFIKRVKRLGSIFGMPVDSPLPDDTFGLFYRVKEDVSYKKCTNADNYRKIVQLTRKIVWTISCTKLIAENSMLTINLNFWNGKYCNMLNGTDGTQFHPSISSSETLYTFAIDICRSIYFESVGTVDVKGINLLRFRPAARSNNGPHKEPSNKCFCVKPKSEEAHCQVDGILEISTCKNGAPIAITAPHFYKVDPRIAKLVNGLSPNQKFHETFIDIEPNTGLAMNAAKRIQVNVETQNYRNIR
ncbi:Lysosome membrane protein 2-like protein, partial [Leptotrombidium deliense]